jgi:hypothetical protein
MAVNLAKTFESGRTVTAHVPAVAAAPQVA